MKLTVEEILSTTGGKLLSGKSEGTITSISTDTRSLKQGDFYVALKGANFDGHVFVMDAIKKGSSGVLVSDKMAVTSGLTAIQVSNTEKALGDMAQAWRKKFFIPVVGLTGSSGKTTTKDMLTACLQEVGPVCATQGNLNNLIGLPKTIFTLEAKHRYAVWEMGMNAFGEIARLTEIAGPTIGLITNVGLAHLEGVGSLSGVAKAKGELFEGLASQAVAIVNADDAEIRKLIVHGPQISFGRTQPADVQVQKIKYTADGSVVQMKMGQGVVEFQTPLTADYQVDNFAACVAVCEALQIPAEKIQMGIQKFSSGKMRGERIDLAKGITVINDTYNANPTAMRVALEALANSYPNRRKIAVLGEMWELGDKSDDYHAQVGEDVAKAGIKELFIFGEKAEPMKKSFPQARHYLKMDELIADLQASLKSGDVLLVKGSRGARMERVVESLTKL